MVLNGIISGKIFCLLFEKENIIEYYRGGLLRLFYNLYFFFILKSIVKILNEKILGLFDVNFLDFRLKYLVLIFGLCVMRFFFFRVLWFVCFYFERVVIFLVNVSFKNWIEF